MKRIAAARLSALLTLGIAFSLTACSSGGGSGSSNNGPLDLAGTWTVSTVSTAGEGSFSGKATITQSGAGLGVNGSTTLAAAGAVGQIVISQTGTALTGTIADSLKRVSHSFIGTLSNGNLTLTGSAPCSGQGPPSETTTIAAAITSSSIQGTYTISRPQPACYYKPDAGTFVATKQ